MRIVLDCDEVILKSTVASKQAYLDLIDPSADIPDDTYPSNWPVWNGDPKENKEKWEKVVKEFRESKWLTLAPPVSGAVESIRKLKTNGHELYVLTAVGGGDDIVERRRKHIETLVGTDVLADTIHVEPLESKKDKLIEIGAEVLVDDGGNHITSALEIGMTGIWFRCPENAARLDKIMNGDDNYNGGWKLDTKLLRDKAIVANGWADVLKIIESKS